MDEDQRKAFNDMCCQFDESMKQTLDILSEIFALHLKHGVKVEETPKKTVKKRQPRKAKTDVKKEITMTSDILTLNENAPIAAHHSGDKGKGKIEFVELE